MTLKEIGAAAYTNAVKKGFWSEKQDNTGQKLMLVVSELSETLEEYRNGKMDYYESEGGKPEGFGVELADAIIRICDLAERHGIDLDDLVERKMAYNLKRPVMHGGKTC